MAIPAKKLDYAVIIGRFEPFHNGHKRLFDYALTQADKLIVVVGSAHRPRTIKNPFTAIERILMISDVYSSQTAIEDRIYYTTVNDYTYDWDAWLIEVQKAVDEVINRCDDLDSDDVTIGMVKNGKDAKTTEYLEIFPQYKTLTPPKDLLIPLDATYIRDILFTFDVKASTKKIAPLVPAGVLAYLEAFKKTTEFGYLANEFGFIRDYKMSWSRTPYPVTFVTVDAVVVQAGHVLVIKRRAAPGKGLLAIPGGFLDQKETIETGMLRELEEETKLKVPAKVLKGSIREWKVFDDPNRSFRGRTITNAAFIRLQGDVLPKVKGSDDAEKAFWMPLSEIRSDDFFDDHFDIIQYFLGRI